MATELAQQEKTPDQTETPRRVTKLPRDSVELLEVKRFTKSKTSFLAISRSGTAQTSDHSINLVSLSTSSLRKFTPHYISLY